MPTITEKANVVTNIPGYNENEELRSSAIPGWFDEWFHGDFDTVREQSLSDARGTKTLEEYTDSENPFPDWRIDSVIEMSFDTPDNQTVSNPQVEWTDPGDSSTPGGMAPITLEGASDEPSNPFRNEFDYYDDGHGQKLPADVKGPHTAGPEKVGPINGVEGYRASLILGGSDPYLQELKEDGETLASIIPVGNVPAVFSNYYLHVATFYSFLDLVLMADGTKLIRVWDASVYPAHALYVGGEKEDQNEFDEGDEWVTQGPLEAHDAFNRFGLEASFTFHTPFDGFGSWGYRTAFDAGSGPHPVMDYELDGTQTTADTVRNQLSSPLFPGSLAPV